MAIEKVLIPDNLTVEQKIKLLKKTVNILNNNADEYSKIHDTLQSLLLNPIHTYEVCLSIAANAVNNSKDGIDCIMPIPTGGLYLSGIVASILEVPLIIPYKGPNAPSEWVKVKGDRHTYSIDPDLVDIDTEKNILVMDDRTSVGLCTKAIMQLAEKINGKIVYYSYFELEERSFDKFLANTKLDKKLIHSVIKK